MSFKINILDHNYCELIDYPQQLKQLLTYETKTYSSWTKKFSVDYTCLINFETNTTYTGLVDFISSNFKPDEIIDNRIFPKVDYEVPVLSVEPRPYQLDYLLHAVNNHRALFEASTGSGKTLIAALIIATLKLPSLVIAPDKTLLGQLHSELTKLLRNDDIGRISGEYRALRDITIGLPLSLNKLSTEELQKFKLLIVDEAHKSAANVTHDLIMRQNAPFRYGFSGTPEGRSDNKDLIVQGLFGPIIKLVERADLVKDGYLAKTSVDIYRGWFEGDFNALEDLLIVNNVKRNELICKIVKSNKKETIIILVRKIRHGEILQEMIGKESFFINGDASIIEREDIRKDIKNGKYRVLIATKMFGTGLDIPQLELGINAKGGKAEIDTGQGLGRVVRPWGEVAKRWVDIYDDYNDILERHSQDRIQIYKEQGVPLNFIGFTDAKEKRLKGIK